ncbi:TetR family transcriptional regulator [Agrilactobacillus composti DSM 18527 = JCM 14202]|uniref:TetR family transcriptional regulator n=1 Tax=Agrilactobacillus composti DSM 18527 = JCM 14202 TaxID=1423734 RepID=A0A0R1Y283_9LACO|nr:TetR/AcrR family transcriptional regulator [Agrilactobacillus composti]KRM36113.1 TetR family transcriptional regulator [Agrilactobacillus composti DSM 18527 = JCM 14202]
MPKQVLSRERIMAVGIELINAETPLTFSNLARQLGTKSQALYPYFSNQTDLSYAILEEVLDRLIATLRSRLLGLTGEPALLELALICRSLGLTHLRLSRFLITLPRDKATIAAQKSINTLGTVFNKLLASAFHETRVQILAGRMIRNLIIGELANVGTGWFSNQEISQAASFKWMIQSSLDILSQEDEQG